MLLTKQGKQQQLNQGEGASLPGMDRRERLLTKSLFRHVDGAVPGVGGTINEISDTENSVGGVQRFSNRFTLVTRSAGLVRNAGEPLGSVSLNAADTIQYTGRGTHEQGATVHDYGSNLASTVSEDSAVGSMPNVAGFEAGARNRVFPNN